MYEISSIITISQGVFGIEDLQVFALKSCKFAKIIEEVSSSSFELVGIGEKVCDIINKCGKGNDRDVDIREHLRAETICWGYNCS